MGSRSNRAQLAERVQRPDLLVLERCSTTLERVARRPHRCRDGPCETSIGPLLGLSQPDTDVIVSMVEHHLLLPDVACVATSDPATIALVASQVGDAQRLELLHALTESDSKATGHQRGVRGKRGWSTIL